MAFLERLLRRTRADREFLIAQVLARHAAWFPAHNRGREAPLEARSDWERRLRPLPEKDLIRLIADNRARNLLLGKSWPRDSGRDSSDETEIRGRR
jgi:hypothetical protein